LERVGACEQTLCISRAMSFRSEVLEQWRQTMAIRDVSKWNCDSRSFEMAEETKSGVRTIVLYIVLYNNDW